MSAKHPPPPSRRERPDAMLGRYVLRSARLKQPRPTVRPPVVRSGHRGGR